jgi:hypothetical protein
MIALERVPGSSVMASVSTRRARGLRPVRRIVFRYRQLTLAKELTSATVQLEDGCQRAPPSGSCKMSRAHNVPSISRASVSAAASSGGGAGEIRTRERGTPVTAFPVRSLETASVCGLRVFELQSDLNLTATPLQLAFNGTLFAEMP